MFLVTQSVTNLANRPTRYRSAHFHCLRIRSCTFVLNFINISYTLTLYDITDIQATNTRTSTNKQAYFLLTHDVDFIVVSVCCHVTWRTLMQFVLANYILSLKDRECCVWRKGIGAISVPVGPEMDNPREFPRQFQFGIS